MGGGGTVKKKIEYIMKEFDFNKVHRHMNNTRWVWALSGSVPSLGQIKSTAKGLLKDVCKEKGFCRISTGGFYAEKTKQKILSLSFIVAEIDTSDIEDI